jgi:hypothetical protein
MILGTDIDDLSGLTPIAGEVSFGSRILITTAADAVREWRRQLTELAAGLPPALAQNLNKR